MTDWLPGLLDEILAAEGWPAYTHAPDDRGGPTKGGVTLATLREWRGRPVTVDDLRALTEQEARQIYTVRYVTAPKFGEIVDGLLRWQVVDAGVMSGPRRATEWLQAVAGTKPDGVYGSKTDARVNALSPHALGVQFAAVRIRFLGRLIERDRTQARWAAGWLNRATKFLDLEADRFREMRK